ncbi:hypothetical protein FMUBM48_02490 [Nocardia cyriacigeorgica]|nr:hypothetical protein FMUBM48_02490 [Nocardia cyriacigeorgica]
MRAARDPSASVAVPGGPCRQGAARDKIAGYDPWEYRRGFALTHEGIDR